MLFVISIIFIFVIFIAEQQIIRTWLALDFN